MTQLVSLPHQDPGLLAHQIRTSHGADEASPADLELSGHGRCRDGESGRQRDYRDRENEDRERHRDHERRDRDNSDRGDSRREQERSGRRQEDTRVGNGERSRGRHRETDERRNERHREDERQKDIHRKKRHREDTYNDDDYEYRSLRDISGRRDKVAESERNPKRGAEKQNAQGRSDEFAHLETSKGTKRNRSDGEKERIRDGEKERIKDGEKEGIKERIKDGEKEGIKDGERERIKDGERERIKDREKERIKDGERERIKDREKERIKDGDTNGITPQQNRHSSMKDKPSIDVPRKPEQAETGRTGGVYIPPFKIAQMMKDIQDKSSPEYQRMTWDALRKSINGLVNKVNASNIKNIIPELFSENLIRGRGLFARSCMKSQMASPAFTHVFAALVAVVNTKFPELGELVLKRVILQFRRALRRNDKPLLLAAAKFIAHLVNQQVAHEVVALEILMVLLENPTDDSVEVAVGFVKECGAMLQDLAPQGVHGIFERFRGILHEGEIDKRVQFMIEGVFAIRKANFQGHQAVLPELDLVEQEDQITHEISLNDEIDDEKALDVFKVDPNYLENEKKFEAIKNDILGEESDDDSEAGNNSEDNSEEDDDDDESEDEQKLQIQDETETNLVNLRRTIYLTIMSSVDFEEAGHKLLKIKLEPGQEMELNVMLLECCSQERTYLRYYGLLGQRFCMLNQIYQANFDDCFKKQYSMIHRLETNKLRNVAKFFAHLLATDALPWNSLGYIRLTEEDTTSSSRIFIKILFQELSEHLGLRKLNERLNDPMMQESFEGIFPKDNPKNTRFAINFFTSIGLGGITDSLRDYLKNMPRLIMQQQKPVDSESETEESSGSSDTSESESSSSESGSDSSDSSDSTSEEEESSDDRRKSRRKR